MWDSRCGIVCRPASSVTAAGTSWLVQHVICWGGGGPAFPATAHLPPAPPVCPPQFARCGNWGISWGPLVALFGTHLSIQWDTFGPTRGQVGIGQPAGMPPPPTGLPVCIPPLPPPASGQDSGKSYASSQRPGFKKKLIIIHHIVQVEGGIHGARRSGRDGGRGCWGASVWEGARPTIRTELAQFCKSYLC